MKRVLLIIDYFGRWPDWIDVFLRSCAHNPSIDWRIHTDCPLPALRPANVHFVQQSFDDYCRQASERLDVQFSPFLREEGKPPRPLYINLCDLRPCYADVHAQAVQEYDYFGWCDIDLVFGNLRRFLTPEVLEKDVVTFSSDLVSGHFTLLRNDRRVARMYRDIPRWRQRIEGRQGCTPWDDCLDESWMSRLCSPNPDFRRQAEETGVAQEALDRHRNDNAFIREWVTPFIPWNWSDGDCIHPEVWYWRDGEIGNWRDAGRSFPYLHFMNFKDHRYVARPLYEMQGTWKRRNPVDAAALTAEVIRIDRGGISGMSTVAAAADECQLREHRLRAGRIDTTGMSARQALQALGPAGVAWEQDSLVDRAGAVSAACREALWRERGGSCE
jgi:hypothetical protein